MNLDEDEQYESIVARLTVIKSFHHLMYDLGCLFDERLALLALGLESFDGRTRFHSCLARRLTPVAVAQSGRLDVVQLSERERIQL